MKRSAFGLMAILVCMVVFLLWAAWQFHKQGLSALATAAALVAVIAFAFVPGAANTAWRAARGNGTSFIRPKAGK